MTIKIGNEVPESMFKIIGTDGPEEISISSILSDKKVVLFGVPGAFTPTCHHNHLPGFLKHLDAIKQKGVDQVGVVSVNDVWVMHEWSIATNGKGKILYLADGSAKFTKACGLDVDLSAAGMGVRSKRYSMIIDNGILTSLNIEEAPGVANLSGAAAILDQLG